MHRSSSKLGNLFYWLHSGLWMIPSLLMGCTFFLAYGMLYLDSRWQKSQLPFWIYSGEGEAAREILAVIAGSMLTVVGVVFSITVVALTMASNQFGPRLLRNFTSDLGNQTVLGAFLATFLYCLLILRKIDGGDAFVEGVPHASVTLGLALSIIDIGLLIYFIHHVSESLQIDHQLVQVAREAEKSLDATYPAGGKAGPIERDDGPPPETEGLPFRAELGSDGSGYIQTISIDELVKQAEQMDGLFILHVNSGKFVAEGDGLLTVVGICEPHGELSSRVNDAFILGANRTPMRDIGYNVDRLVEICLRSLSSSLNDSITAMKCLDRMGQFFSRMAQRDYPSPYHRDKQGAIRVVSVLERFPDMLSSSFEAILSSSEEQPFVRLRALNVLAQVVGRVKRHEDFMAINEVAGLYAYLPPGAPDWEKKRLQDGFTVFQQRSGESLRRLEKEDGSGIGTGPRPEPKSV